MIESMKLLIVLFILTGGFIIYLLFSSQPKSVQFTSAGVDIPATPQSNPNSQTGQIEGSEFITTFTKPQIEVSNRSFYPAKSLLPVQYEVDKYIIRYSSLDEKNQPVIISAQLFLPKAPTRQKFPVYVFGQGTTGLGDNCAPSKEKVAVSNWGNYLSDMISFAGQGYIVIFPDYEGFNDPTRLHHYFIADTEAKTLLDGTRAVYNFLEKENTLSQPEQTVFLAGYSQGGHAAFAAYDLAKSYAPELPIKGIINYGGTTNIINLLKENPTLAPYLVYAYVDFYGREIIDPQQVLAADLLPTLERDTKTTCIGDIYKRYGSNPQKIFSPKFYSSLVNGTLEQDFPKIKKVLDENNSGLSANNIPSFTPQGTIDPIVTVSSTKQFLTKVCQKNKNVSYLEYPGIHHYQIRQISFKDVLAWMKQIRQGNIPESACNNFN